jgi:hypothetical protein
MFRKSKKRNANYIGMSVNYSVTKTKMGFSLTFLIFDGRVGLPS